MSWSFRKAATNKAAMVNALKEPALGAPMEVRARCIAQVEAINLQPGQVVVVISQGHYDVPTPYPSWGKSTEETQVFVLPLSVDVPSVPNSLGG